MQTQLVLLDHGLYRHISDDLRLNYAALWQVCLPSPARLFVHLPVVSCWLLLLAPVEHFRRH